MGQTIDTKDSVPAEHFLLEAEKVFASLKGASERNLFGFVLGLVQVRAIDTGRISAEMFDGLFDRASILSEADRRSALHMLHSTLFAARDVQSAA